MKKIDCASVDERDLVALYLGGRLPEAEAETFELHYFGCERCWGEVRGTAEIRAAHGLPVLAAPSEARRDRERDIWTLLAAAAAVAVMVLGLRQLAERTEVSQPGSVFRSSREEPLSLTVRPSAPGQFVLQWNARPEAQVYVVQIFGPDGATVWERETSETSVTLEAGALPPIKPGISFVGTVEALDMTRQSVARSQRTRLPPP